VRIAEKAAHLSNREVMLDLAQPWRGMAVEDEAKVKPAKKGTIPFSPDIAGIITESATPHAEARRLRKFALGVSDSEVLTGIQEMVEDLERYARLFDNGGADES